MPNIHVVSYIKCHKFKLCEILERTQDNNFENGTIIM